MSITITNITDLQKIGNDPSYPLGGDYELGNDIDASATNTWNAGAGFDPIGTYASPFTGTFDGKSYSITEPYDGSLLKTLLAFVAPNKINVDDVYGILVDETFDVKDSQFNNGGKNITKVTESYVTPQIEVEQRIHDESPVSTETKIPSPNNEVTIEDTINIIQAHIADVFPALATGTQMGLVKLANSISLIPSPVNSIEEKINKLITALRNAGQAQ